MYTKTFSESDGILVEGSFTELLNSHLGYSSTLRAFFITFSPEEAKWVLDNLNTANRKLTDSAIRSLSKRVLAGEWMVNGDTICFAYDPISGRMILQDGQHRLAGCVRSNQPIQTLVVTGLPPETFATKDIGKMRSFNDFFSIREKDSKSLDAKIVRQIANIVQGQATEHGSVATRPTALSYEECIQIFAPYESFYNRLRSSFLEWDKNKSRTATAKTMRSHLVFICAVATIALHDGAEEGRIKDFFGSIWDLNVNLSETTNAMVNKMSTDNKKLTPLQRQHLIVDAWNSWIENRPPRTKFFINSDEYFSPMMVISIGK